MMSTSYVTHQFAHLETLERAHRWLLQVGFSDGQIEVHREGLPWISVLAAPGQGAEATRIFEAAECHDPDGWPSFWDLSKVPHAHVERVPEDSAGTSVVTARPSEIGWHPEERNES